jgi:4-aminobutyrate aminotransferase-like enzyme
MPISRKTNLPPTKPKVKVEEAAPTPSVEYKPSTTKYLFTPKHHRKLAEFCAAHIKKVEQREREQAWQMAYDMGEMLQADHREHFKPTEFFALVHQLVDQK